MSLISICQVGRARASRPLASARIVVAVLLASVSCGALAQNTTTVTEIPQFRPEGAWTKLPDRWTMSLVSSTWVDDDQHLWVLQRPRSLPDEERSRAAPPVLEFDQNGNFIQGWGGPGDGFDWPETEHGIHVDPQGFVWVGGNGEEDQILKFTKSGEFVMQIGKPGQPKTNADTENLYRPADMVVHAASNELIVADGYGNKRIIVFDADTGEFKRMWGAFGGTPSDAPAAPRVGSDGNAELLAHPLGPDGAPQFVPPVHAVKVSNDGLVYVADRGGKRVQIFTLDGGYVDQLFIGRECRAPDCGNGTTAAGVAFSTDAEQRYLYVANRSQAQIMVFDRRALAFLDAFGSWGSEPGQFGTLHHLSVDGNGNLYTAEVTPRTPANRRVQRFTLTGFVPVPTAEKHR